MKAVTPMTISPSSRGPIPRHRASIRLKQTTLGLLSGYAGTRDAYISENAPTTAFGTATTLLADGSDPIDSNLDLSTLLLWDLSAIPSDAMVDGATMLGAVTGSVTGSHTVVLNQEGLDVVQSWIDGSAPNNGLIIADTSATNGLDFSSREVDGPLDRPKLSVTYSLPSGGPDTEPPSPPSGLTVDSKTTTTISLSWQPCASAPCDNVGVTGYKVYRNTKLAGSPTMSSFVDSGLTPSTPYDDEVSSVDAAGNESSTNPTIMVTTDPVSTPTVLVNDIAMSLQSNKKWRFTRTQVTVVDGNAQPVSGVTVSSGWSGLTSANVSGDTAADGTLTFASAQAPKSATGNFVFAVTSLAKTNYIYDNTANVETSDCIDTSGTDCSGDPDDPTITMHAAVPMMTAIASRKHWSGEAAVPITEADDATPVSGATVIGDWTFQAVGGQPIALGSTSAVTDSLGIARVLSSKQRANAGDTFTFVLVGVTKPNAQFESTGLIEGTAVVPAQ